ncbi:hypothetical protein E2K93_10780 [Thalassotalea sp. HSM 43]|uniref:hypothetical protein n=1 Tax=Thalassotalea sp. HSM 43 TaxID=2552945 RepID=UPI001081FC61|nr:hypothetical protein [Thalassotalea sp. HSM 43]QBY04836.1 hypothetical protein E2K93_10780 [Thalassotalea sp. HSM 43]
MKTSTHILKGLKLPLATLLLAGLAHSHMANAKMVDEDLAHLNSTFKIAMIENSTGLRDINAGDYEDALSKINSASDVNEKLELLMANCVANLKLSRFSEAKIACDKAIEVISNNESNASKYLTAIAYSNRAIVNHYLGDKVSAFKDFNTAMKYDDNRIVKANIEAMTVALMKKEMLASNH